MYRPALLFLTILAILGDRPATAGPSGSADPWTLCGRETAARERADRIPNHLLTAISLIETGRRRDRDGATTAWPWSLNAEGTGYFLPTKAAALDKIRDLRAAGRRSIDVGCMQVNLVHHADAFESLEEALDPAANVAYAARFLRRLRDRDGSWSSAAGRYHSGNPEHGLPYRDKVVAAWRALGDGGAPSPSDSEVAAASIGTWAPLAAEPPARPATVDQARTHRLNRLGAERLAAGRAAASPADRRRAQLDEWRALRDHAPFTVLAAMRLGRLDKLRRDETRGPTAAEKQAAFAERRRRQLDQWRARNDTDQAASSPGP